MLLMNGVQLEMICSITELTEIGTVHIEKASFYYSPTIKLFQGHFCPIIFYRLKIQVG